MSLMPLELLIDGPMQTDKCGRPTPAGPAWLWQPVIANGSPFTMATLARFGLVGVPGSSFDVVTTHPPYDEYEIQKYGIDAFIQALTSPPYRMTAPYYPVVVLGDFNGLARTPWPSGTTQVFSPADSDGVLPKEVMAIAVGDGSGPLPPVNRLRMIGGAKLPSQTPCRPSATAFSDHCGLLVRFTE
jgi:hypothetical protein